MTDSFTMRTATAGDICTIVSHRRAMFEEMGNADRAALDLMDEKFQDWVGEKFASGEYRHWFVLNEKGEIIAGAGLWLLEWPPVPTDASARRADVLNVYTEREYRRRGLARRLTTAILDWCRDNGIRTVILHASDTGRALYESLGFRSTNEMRTQL